MQVLHITDEMIQQAYQQIQAQREGIPAVLIEDRPRISDGMRHRMVERGLQFNVPSGPLTVILEDPITHTVDFPVCGDEDCICQALEREQIIAETTPRKRRRKKVLINTNCEPSRADSAALNGNRPFRLLA